MTTNLTNCTKPTTMTYSDRIRRYESEKQQLERQPLTPNEYEKLARALARKWRI